MSHIPGKRIQSLTYIAVFAALLTVCSWIAIPTPVPVTLQTLGVFLAVGLLGGRRGTTAVLVWLLMAAVGLPVLSGFRGGIGALLGSTGGYAVGFLLTALVMWAAEHLPGHRAVIFPLSMAAGLLVCYSFGTVWFVAVYARTGQEAALSAVLAACVWPFVLPDMVKAVCAAVLAKKLRRHIR